MSFLGHVQNLPKSWPTLRALLVKTWPITFMSALLGFGATILTVRVIGLVPFADYAIDLAKLSLVLLLAEAVPSSFSIFRQQRDRQFRDSLPSFFLLAMLAALLGTAFLKELSIFSAFSNWMYVYIASSVVQRYLDCRLQADGRTREFFLLPLAANLVRLLALFGAMQVFANAAPASIVWGAVALGASMSLLLFFVVRPAELVPFVRKNHFSSLLLLWRIREHYYAYYPNIALKRLRDVAMPLVCDTLVSDRKEAGRYLLAFRGVEFVCGQLRVIEAFLSNFSLRDSLASGRAFSLLALAIVGQLAAAISGLILAGQAGMNASTIIAALSASFFVYPYVAEIAARSDAYAKFAPRRVTIALLFFVAGLVTTIVVASQFTALTAPVLVLGPLVGQSLASASYRLFRWHDEEHRVRARPQEQ